MSAMWKRLVETDEARRAYRGEPWGTPLEGVSAAWFNRIVSHVRDVEEAGGDPIAALRDGLLVLCRDHARVTKEWIACMDMMAPGGPLWPRELAPPA